MVELGALRLDDEGWLPFDAEPCEVFEDGVEVGGFGAVGVDVFVAEEEGAVVVAGAGGGLPEGSSVAEMEEAGGRWSEATTVEHGGIVTDEGAQKLLTVLGMAAW